MSREWRDRRRVETAEGIARCRPGRGIALSRHEFEVSRSARPPACVFRGFCYRGEEYGFPALADVGPAEVESEVPYGLSDCKARRYIPLLDQQVGRPAGGAEEHG